MHGITIQVVKIKHPSEKANNPVDEVLFYKKAKTPNDLPATLSKDVALRKVYILDVLYIPVLCMHVLNDYTCRPL
jgi:hypothetical protein